MNTYEPVKILPADIQSDWQAQLIPGYATAKGIFNLVGIRRTKPQTFEEGRLIVLVVDENGFPLPNVRIVFSYSTAAPFVLGPEYSGWVPPPPWRGDVVYTTGGGQIEHIQGGVVKKGEPGGIMCYVLEPGYASDVLTGLGALADHTGLKLTFQLRRAGVVPLAARIDAIEARLTALESVTASCTSAPTVQPY